MSPISKPQALGCVFVFDNEYPALWREHCSRLVHVGHMTQASLCLTPRLRIHGLGADTVPPNTSNILPGGLGFFLNLIGLLCLYLNSASPVVGLVGLKFFWCIVLPEGPI